MNNPNPIPTQNTESFIKRLIPNSQPFDKSMIYLSIFIMSILAIITIVVIYTQAKKVELGNTNHAVNINMSSGDIFLITMGCLVFVSMAIIYFRFPEFYHNIIITLTNSSYLFFLLLYIIFIIVLYQNILTPEQITDYSFFIFPITIIIGIVIFYLNITSTISHFLSINTTIDRVKYSIIYFCLIVILFLFYYINPNNYISQYLGPYLVVSILIAVFGLLYLITLMTFPAKGNSSQNTTSLFSRFNPFTIFSAISFIIFLVLVTSGILYFPGGFTNSDKGTQTGIILLILAVCLSWITTFVLSLFRGETNSAPSANESSVFSFYGNIFRNVLLLAFGITISSLLIYWLVSGVQNLTSKSGIASFIFNLIIILVIFGLMFRILSGTSFYQNSPLSRLLINTFLYIPCLFINLVDGLAYVFGIVKKYSPSPNLTNISLGSTTTITENTSVYFVYLGIIVIAIIGYLIYPYVEEKVTDQGGTLLINQPIYLNNLTNLASYQSLNKIKEIDMGNTMNPMQFNYNYAISFWAFFDSENPSRTNQYTSILNYGNKPNILFSPTDNTLIFVSNKANASAINNFSLSQLEENGNQVLYEHKNVLLQKWNNIIVNYNGGTLDIFINGKLEKSVIGVIPYKTLDTLQVGSENGIQGGICNLNYFANVLNIQQIYYLYNLLKDKTPPVHSSSQDTIINIMDQVPNIVNHKPIEISSNETYSKNLDAAINDATSTISEGVKEFATINDARYIPNNNYLSWDWYFKNNKY